MTKSKSQGGKKIRRFLEEAIAWAKFFKSIGNEIADEARPNYEENDNEVYTIVDLQIHNPKFEKWLKKVEERLKP